MLVSHFDSCFTIRRLDLWQPISPKLSRRTNVRAQSRRAELAPSPTPLWTIIENFKAHMSKLNLNSLGKTDLQFGLANPVQLGRKISVLLSLFRSSVKHKWKENDPSFSVGWKSVFKFSNFQIFKHKPFIFSISRNHNLTINWFNPNTIRMKISKIDHCASAQQQPSSKTQRLHRKKDHKEFHFLAKMH